MEKAGWRQGSILKNRDIKQVLKKSDSEISDGLVIIVASQSCDIANNNVEIDPIVELSIAREVHRQDGNLTFNKNPRVLHSVIQTRAETLDGPNECFIELRAWEKFTIQKTSLVQLAPDSNRFLVNKELYGYVSWLSSRYLRPALPTEFNNRIAMADPKNRRRKEIKVANDQLSGLYVEVMPDREIQAGQNYSVNLLGVVSSDFTDDVSKTISAVESYAAIMRAAGMDVVVSVRREDQISIAMLKRFKRFYYDDLSLKLDAPTPPDAQGML